MKHNPDLICLCANITRQEIEEAAQRGSMTALYERGMCCWCRGCKEEIEEILKEGLIQDSDA